MAAAVHPPARLQALHTPLAAPDPPETCELVGNRAPSRSPRLAASGSMLGHKSKLLLAKLGLATRQGDGRVPPLPIAEVPLSFDLERALLRFRARLVADWWRTKLENGRRRAREAMGLLQAEAGPSTEARSASGSTSSSSSLSATSAPEVQALLGANDMLRVGLTSCCNSRRALLTPCALVALVQTALLSGVARLSHTFMHSLNSVSVQASVCVQTAVRHPTVSLHSSHLHD